MRIMLRKAHPIFALGPPGSHSHQTLIQSHPAQLIWREKDITFCTSNTEVLHRAKSERGFCIIAAENSRGGPVDEVIRFWLEQPTDCSMHIIGEIQVPIRQHLMAYPGVTIGDIDEIYSHPQAIAQCRKSITHLCPHADTVIMSSTAKAAEYVASNPELKIAAIASDLAARIYGLEIIQRDIQDNQNNVTCFHIIAPAKSYLFHILRFLGIFEKGQTKTAVIFKIPNVSGSLSKAIEGFAKNGINMSSLHSIPLGTFKKSAFYCKFDCSLTSRTGKTALKKLKKVSESTLILGSFQCYP